MLVTTLGERGAVAVVRRDAHGWPLDGAGGVVAEPDEEEAARRGDWPATEEISTHDDGGEHFCVLHACAFELNHVVDSTGAGDAFIAGVALGAVRRLGLRRTLALGSRIAWHKLQSPGARSGLPRAEQLDAFLS